jgi:hypothetical protein
MDRTRQFLSLVGVPGSSLPSSKKPTSPFNESASSIARLLLSISDSIREHSAAFIDKHEFLLARKSSMSEEDREHFVAELTCSLDRADTMIGRLGDNVSTGRIPFQGNGLDFAREVFRGLDLRLRAVRRQLSQLQDARNKLKFQSRTITKESVKVPAAEPIEIESEFQERLIVEHDPLVDELLHERETIIRIQQMGMEVAQTQIDYRTQIIEQTERIHVIRNTIDEAAENYDKGTKDLSSLTERAKRQNLWISLVIIAISLLLLIKQLREDLKRW